MRKRQPFSKTLLSFDIHINFDHPPAILFCIILGVEHSLKSCDRSSRLYSELSILFVFFGGGEAFPSNYPSSTKLCLGPPSQSSFKSLLYSIRVKERSSVCFVGERNSLQLERKHRLFGRLTAVSILITSGFGHVYHAPEIYVLLWVTLISIPFSSSFCPKIKVAEFDDVDGLFQ